MACTISKVEQLNFFISLGMMSKVQEMLNERDANNTSILFLCDYLGPPLIHAVMCNKLDITKLILDKAKAEGNLIDFFLQSDQRGNTSLMIAIQKRNIEIFETILEYGDPRLLLEQKRTTDNQTVLEMASETQDPRFLAVIEKFLKKSDPISTDLKLLIKDKVNQYIRSRSKSSWRGFFRNNGLTTKKIALANAFLKELEEARSSQEVKELVHKYRQSNRVLESTANKKYYFTQSHFEICLNSIDDDLKHDDPKLYTSISGAGN